MKESGRSTIEATKSQVVSLASEEDGPQLELSYYEKGSEFATDDYSVGYGTDHLASKVEDLDKSSFRSQTTRLSLQNSMWKLIRADGLTLLIQMEYTLNYSHKVN